MNHHAHDPWKISPRPNVPMKRMNTVPFCPILIYLTEISSTSKIKVLLGGMGPTDKYMGPHPRSGHAMAGAVRGASLSFYCRVYFFLAVPAWITVKVWPLTVSVPVRLRPVFFVTR